MCWNKQNTIHETQKTRDCWRPAVGWGDLLKIAIDVEELHISMLTLGDDDYEDDDDDGDNDEDDNDVDGGGWGMTILWCKEINFEFIQGVRQHQDEYDRRRASAYTNQRSQQSCQGVGWVL